jgi:hypothetical protein
MASELTVAMPSTPAAAEIKVTSRIHFMRLLPYFSKSHHPPQLAAICDEGVSSRLGRTPHSQMNASDAPTRDLIFESFSLLGCLLGWRQRLPPPVKPTMMETGVEGIGPVNPTMMETGVEGKGPVEPMMAVQPPLHILHWINRIGSKLYVVGRPARYNGHCVRR